VISFVWSALKMKFGILRCGLWRMKFKAASVIPGVDAMATKLGAYELGRASTLRPKGVTFGADLPRQDSPLLPIAEFLCLNVLSNNRPCADREAQTR
jgi:hypothetical protein